MLENSGFRYYFVENFDYKLGAMGGALFGGSVFYAKFSDGVELAAIAGGEQFVFNFLLGGALMKLCEKLATRYKSKAQAITLAILIPSIINIVLTYLMHCLDEGEVHPIMSTIPSIIFAPMGYIWWAGRKRRLNTT
jgi:hypothetical protein